MAYSVNGLRTFALISALFIFNSCSKQVEITPNTNFVNNKDAQMVQDWTELALDLSSKSNGYSDPVASRALYYTAVTLYESLVHGLEGHTTVQARLAMLNTTLPQPDPALRYNWIIVSNQALYQVATELYQASGSENISRVKVLRDKFINAASIELDPEIIRHSKELGNEIGWKIIDYSKRDGMADAYLNNYPDYDMPQNEGAWRPSPPDYFSKPLLPYWGNSPLAIPENEHTLKPVKDLIYSSAQSSIIYAEAVEVHNLTASLTPEQKEKFEYWYSGKNPHASPLCHNMSLMVQLIKDNRLSLERATSLFLRLSLMHYDGYIIAWKNKYDKKLLRPANYIKLHIERFFIPEYSCLPVPEFVSDKALLYAGSARIFSEEFGYRYAFMDYTQTNRPDLREGTKYFSSFVEMAEEASYADLYGALQFRTSIDAGYQLGWDIAANVIAFPLKK